MTESLDAYQWFLRGRLHFERRTSRDLRDAVAAFERATASDPSYALAYAWVANTYTPAQLPRLGPAVGDGTGSARGWRKGALARRQVWPRRTSVLRWSWPFTSGAGETPRRRIAARLELDPNYATGHHWYAFFLMTLGRFDEALDERRRALEIDPLTPDAERGARGAVHRHAPARSRGLTPSSGLSSAIRASGMARLTRGQALEQLGRHQEALQDFVEAERAAPDSCHGDVLPRGRARGNRTMLAKREDAWRKPNGWRAPRSFRRSTWV